MKRAMVADMLPVGHKKRPVLIWLCAGFGSGFSPRAPGTSGSAVGVVLGALLLPLGSGAVIAAGVSAVILGYFAVRAATTPEEKDTDPSWIVIDEIAGQLLALAPAAPGFHWRAIGLSFLLFRVLDIWKPGPVGWADRQGGAFGIVADDVIAGVLAAFCLLALRMMGF